MAVMTNPVQSCSVVTAADRDGRNRRGGGAPSQLVSRMQACEALSRCVILLTASMNVCPYTKTTLIEVMRYRIGQTGLRPHDFRSRPNYDFCYRSLDLT